MDETPVDHQTVVEKLLVEILKRNCEQAAEISAKLDALSAKLDRPVAAKEAIACDACGRDITDQARILLGDGKVICGACTQLPPEMKVAPQICGRGER